MPRLIGNFRYMPVKEHRATSFALIINEKADGLPHGDITAYLHLLTYSSDKRVFVYMLGED